MTKTSVERGKAFNVRVVVPQGSASASPLFFVLVLEALSREFRVGMPADLPNADDLVLVAETFKELLLGKIRK